MNSCYVSSVEKLHKYTHMCGKRIMCGHICVHLHRMDTLFIALSALVSWLCFCAARSLTWFMHYGKNNSNADMLTVNCDSVTS